MGYYEFNIKVSEESKDALIYGMSGMGLLGIVEDDESIIAYFLDTTGIETILTGIESLSANLEDSGLVPELSYGYVFISERDWNESWKKKFKPIDVGDNLSIIPPWEDRRSGRINLVVDPGMAFGTGHHETTQRCLMLIELYSKECGREMFLDVGAGTGILSIAASMSGFKRISGVDIDPLAIDASMRNIKLNGIDNIEIREGDISVTDGVYDCITANLMSEILIKIAPELSARLKKPGIAILSGMLTGQDDEVAAVMAKVGLNLIKRFEDGRWVSLVLAH